MIFKPFGDSALLIEFEQKINPAINEKVISLGNTIDAASIEGVDLCIPAYCSLTIKFNPLRISFYTLCRQISKLDIKTSKNSIKRTLKIPVCYNKLFSFDFDILLEQTKLKPEEIIELHKSCTFRVYMMGFLPGFAYIGKLPDALFCKRKANPRQNVPAGSVGIAGHQTGIYPGKSPGGWQIIGRTPLTVFRPDCKDPFLFKSGDSISFEEISVNEFHQISKDISRDDFKWSQIYG
jgi:inhibitor of KinA